MLDQIIEKSSDKGNKSEYTLMDLAILGSHTPPKYSKNSVYGRIRYKIDAYTASRRRKMLDRVIHALCD